MFNRKITISVGIFILITALAIIGSIGYLVKKKRLFEKPLYVNLVAPSGETLVKGLSIKFSGFEIGQVIDLSLNDDGNVQLKLTIPKEQKKWLHKNSKFYLVKPLIGSSYISLRDVNVSQPELDLKKTYKITIEDGIDEIIKKIQPVIEQVEPIVAKIEPVIDELLNIVKNVDSILTKIEDDNGSLFMTMKHVESLTGRFDNSKHLINTVTGDDNSTLEIKAILQGISNNLRATIEVINNLRDTVKHLDNTVIVDNNSTIKLVNGGIHQVNGMLVDVNGKLVKLDKSVDSVNNITKDVDRLGNDLPQIQEEVHYLIQKSDRLLEKINLLLVKEQDKLELP